MKRTICLITVVGMIFMSGMGKSGKSVLSEEQTAAIKAAVLEKHDEIIKAAEELDADKFFGFIIDSGKGTIIQDGQLFTRQEALDMIKDGYAGTTSIDYTFTHRLINVLSPTTAILITAGQVTVNRESGRSFTSEFANTSIFVLKDGGWKIVHGHHSIPNPTP